jgi:hypothetical protein
MVIKLGTCQDLHDISMMDIMDFLKLDKYLQHIMA